MIKCIVTDLDGTLLHSGLLSKKNREAIQMIQDKGIEFMVATGRDTNQMKDIFHEFGFVCDSILLNGACFMNKNSEIEFTIGLNKETVQKVCDVALSKGLGVMFYTKNNVICYRSYEIVNTDFYDAILEYSPNVVTHEFYEKIVNYDEIDEMMKEKPLIAEIMSVNGELIDECMKELATIDGVVVTSSIPKEIEITPKLASKGKALLKVCEQKGYKNEEVVVFGDGGNDLSLFENFKYAYAMENANPMIKEIANYHCGLCEEDGFYHKVCELLGQEEKR